MTARLIIKTVLKMTFCTFTVQRMETVTHLIQVTMQMVLIRLF